MSPTTATLDRIADGAAYDVVVVGAGGAGMAAALFAALEGQRVLLVERTEAARRHHRPVRRHHLDPRLAARGERRRGRGHAGEGGGIPPPDGRQPLQRGDARSLPAQRPRRDRPAGSGNGGAISAPARSIPTTSRKRRKRRCAAARWSRCPSTDRRLGAALALVRPPIPEFTVLGGMMVDRDDIPHLLGMTKSWASFRHCGEAARPLRPGPAAARPRHAAADGQRAGRPAARLAARAGRGHPGRHQGRGAGARRGRRRGRRPLARRHAPAHRRAPRRRHGDRRLQPAPGAARRHAGPRPHRRAQPRRARPHRRDARPRARPPAPATAKARWTTPSGRRSRSASAPTAAPPCSRISCSTAASPAPSR